MAVRNFSHNRRFFQNDFCFFPRHHVSSDRFFTFIPRHHHRHSFLFTDYCFAPNFSSFTPLVYSAPYVAPYVVTPPVYNGYPFTPPPVTSTSYPLTPIPGVEPAAEPTAYLDYYGPLLWYAAMSADSLAWQWYLTYLCLHLAV